MFIDASYFYGPLAIAQITEQSVIDDIANYIAKYEPEFLRALFGYQLSKAIQDPANATVDKYKNIISGVEYTNWFGIPDKWRGLQETMPNEKFKSAIANYVYCFYLNDKITETTGTGEKVASAQNAETASPRAKIARAWNEMVAWNKELIDYLVYNQTTYPEWFVYYDNTDLVNLLEPMNPIF